MFRMHFEIYKNKTYSVRSCSQCGTNASDIAHLKSYTKPYHGSWQMEVVGSQVAFRSMSTGKYLARCKGCMTGHPNADATVVNSSTLTPSALWTPEYQFNGNYSFKGDNGKYLVYSTNPLPQDPSLFVPIFVNAASPIAEAQWYLTYDVPYPMAYQNHIIIQRIILLCLKLVGQVKSRQWNVFEDYLYSTSKQV